MRLPILLVATSAVVLAASCGGEHTADRGGTIVVAAFADPDNLLPPLSRTLAAKAVTDLLFDPLAAIGSALNTVGDAGFEPRLAKSWDWSRDSLRITFHLDPRARWHDGTPVRASDVRFAFALYTDPRVTANGGTDLRDALDSLTADDSVTCTAWFHRRAPEQFFTLVTTLVPLPEHLLATVSRDSIRQAPFGRQPVGDGPFRFVRWDAKVRLEIAAVDSFYRGRAKPDRVIWSIAPEMQTATQKLFAGEADFLEALTPPAAAEAARHPAVRVQAYSSFDYGFLRFNLHNGAGTKPHPLFGDRTLRRALTQAIDRRLLVHSVFDTLAHVALGPFVRAQWTSDSTISEIPFDRAAAARTLDSLGWRTGPDSIRAKNGRRLEFTLLRPSSSKSRELAAVLIQEQLRQVGVKVNIEPVDFSAFMAHANTRDFDAIMDGLHTSPSPAGIRESWSTAGIAKGNGPNYGDYSNPHFDAEVDSAASATNPRAAKAHYRAAYQIIADDAPAIWLFEPEAVAGFSARLQPGALRADGWWLTLPAWSVGGGAH
ncbi:MAG: peptide ABC transporter substrate-binding protein [Gemmatimonadales bacterium]